MRMEGLRYKVFNNLVLVLAILPILAEGQVQFGRCSNEPCLNDGECRGIFRLFYACSCTDGYTGSNCQYERPCNTFPCLNGGSCTDDLDNSSRECTCPPNVSGESCEFVRECVDDDVRCNGYCFPSIVRCDYNADCPDETDEEGCNEIDITPDGVNLTSPYFPRPGYLDNFDYTWYLTSPEDHYISLNFSVFDLEYYQDVIFIGEGEDNSYDNADYKLSGEYEVLRILPKSSSIWIRMVTDDYRSPSIGFKVYANAVPIAEAVLRECDPETEFSCKDGSCLGATVVCDGFNQCTNEADEYSCPRTTCYGGAYIPEYERCNRRWFCPDGEDEYYCEPAQVGEVFYMETPIDVERPTGYIAYSNETWTVATEEGLCLSVYFSSFKTESDYDLWYIGVGNKLSLSAVFLYLSGTYVPEPFLIPINETFVHFESDGSKNDGYVLMELEVVNKTELMYCEKGSYVHRKQICDNEWHCLDGRDEEKCEPLPRGENRIITSAYYPIGYPKNTYQVWTFTTEDDLKLMLHVTTLRTEENFDLLRIGSGSSCVEESYASFSGEMDNQFVISQDNTMCVFFSSDYSVGNIGMTATVSAVAENDYVTCSSDGSVIPAFLQCDFRWNCPTGEDERGCEPLKLYDAIPFQSPNFPGAYPPYSYIIYTASSEPGTETYYTFDIFDVEKGTDYLNAGCGPDPFDANTTVVSLTGYEVEPFTLPCNDVWFTFYSDGHGYNIGYSGTTYVVPASDGLVCSEDGSPVDKDAVCDSKWDCLLTGDDERNCPRIPVNQTAYIRSENYPAPYPRDQFAVFTGEAEDGLHAVVEFFDFDLQAGDSLTFGCGANPYDDLSVIATFTGGEIPPPLTIECASIWFALSTTSSEGDNRGFFGSITTVAPDEGLICSDRTFVPDDRICDGRWECKDKGEDESDCPLIPVDQTVFFQSENYPSPYPTDDFFIYSGEAEAGLSGVVEFLDFDVEDGKDFLTFGCGKDPYDTSSIVATFTGELPPSLIIDCQQIWFTLETDSSEGNNRGYFGSITTVRRIVDPEPPELVAGRCTDYLPYSETVSETKFPLKLPLGREVIRDLIMGPACDDDEVLRGICAILYPPLKADTEQGVVDVCSSTCEKFHLCSSIDLLVDVDCDSVSSNTPHDVLPGLCYEDEKED